MERIKTFGEVLRQLRLEVGMTLREFCKRTGENAGNLSKIERGKLPPPDSVKKLEKYAKVLGITEQDEIRDFLDLARLNRGEVPKDILSDEELARVLPLVFRTLRGQKVDEENLRKLAETIRNA